MRSQPGAKGPGTAAGAGGPRLHSTCASAGWWSHGEGTVIASAL